MLATALLLALSAPPPFECRLEAAGQASVRFTLKNTGREPVSVLTWLTPLEGFMGSVFAVTRGGREVRYTGPQSRRGAPRASDYITLEPGEETSAVVDLAEAYDLAAPGRYRVAFTRGLMDVTRSPPSPLAQYAHAPLTCPVVKIRLTGLAPRR